MNKSPGPDGFGSGFFKSAWNIVGDEVSEVVLDFLKNGKLLKQLNATLISLIPTMPNPMNDGQFRPISCCNTIY